MKNWISGHKKIKRILTGVLIGIILFLCRKPIIDGIQEMRRIPADKIVWIVLLSLCYMTAEGAVVKQVSGIQGRPLSIFKALECVYYCAFLRIATFGSGAGLGEIYYLHKGGIETAKATGLSLVQYMLHKITIALYGITGFLLLYKIIRDYTGGLLPYMGTAIAITAAIIAGIVFIALPSKASAWVLSWLVKVGGRHEKVKKKAEFLSEQARLLQEASAEMLKEGRTLIKIILLNLFKFTCWYLIPFVVYGKYGELSAVGWIAFTALTNMLAGVIPAPSGLGALEAVFVVIYSSVIGKERSISLAIIYRLVTTFLPFAIGSIMAWNQSKSKEEIKITD